MHHARNQNFNQNVVCFMLEMLLEWAYKWTWSSVPSYLITKQWTLLSVYQSLGRLLPWFLFTVL